MHSRGGAGALVTGTQVHHEGLTRLGAAVHGSCTMRLGTICCEGHGQQLASAVSWHAADDVYTCSDDQTVQRWSPQGLNMGKVCALDSSITDLHCSPSAGGGKKQAGISSSSTELFAVACADGSLKLIHSNGRIEKAAEAHSGAALCVRWSPDGNAIATSGEDNQVKIWSRAGMLRSTIMEAEDPVFCLAWGGSAGSELLVCSGSTVSIRSLQGTASGPAAAAANGLSCRGGGRSFRGRGDNGSSSVQACWKAHDGIVLKADWNVITGLIVTGGEDCRCKVWDHFGQLLYSSSPWEHSITSVAWSPDGTMFAAGSFNCLALCDRQGWSYCQTRHAAGSLLGLCWSPDATRIAAAGGTGALVVAAVLEAVVEDGCFTAALTEPNIVSVSDLLEGASERLEFRDAVVKMSIGFGHLVVCTSSHCHVYATSNFNTPHIFDLKGQPHLVLQCGRSFALLVAATGLQVFTYDGRQVCALKPQGLGAEGVSRQLVSLSNDTMAVAVGRSVHCYETAQGRAVGDAVNHGLEVKAVCLSQAGVATDRLLAVLDSNGDLYLVRQLHSSSPGITPGGAAAAACAAAGSGSTATVAGVITASGLVSQGAASQQQQQRLVKLAGNVSSPAVWHDTAPMLAAVVDGQLVVWYHPAAAFDDHQLLQATRRVINTDSNIDAGTSLDLFTGTSLTLRRRDGARVFASTTLQPAMLHNLVRQGKWDKAVRLARFTHDVALWACLAALSMAAGELATAEVAFAAIDAVDKLQYVLHLKGLQAGGAGAAAGAAAGGGGRDPLVASELALYAGQTDEAEAALLQAGLVYRAVKLHVRLHNWTRALELAVKHKQHLDTVLMYRQRYLKAVGQQETLPGFVSRMEGVLLDEAVIKAAIQQDKAKEAQQRTAAQRGKGG